MFPSEKKQKLQEIVSRSKSLLSSWDEEEKLFIFSLMRDLLKDLPKKDSFSYGQGLEKKLTIFVSEKTFKAFLIPFERELARCTQENLKVSHHDTPTSLKPKRKLYFILDNIRSAHNVGAMMRLADCVACEEIFLLGYTAGSDHKAVKKASMGTEKLLKVTHHDHPEQLFRRLKKDNVHIVGLETLEGASSLFDPAPERPMGSLALLVGNERHGVSLGLLDLCDEVLTIPVWGEKNSLNVTSALAIAAYAFRQSS